MTALVFSLHEHSCQNLFFLLFCPPIWKLALFVNEEWGNNISPCQCIKEWESSTFSLAKFLNNFVDVVEPIWDCTAQKGKTTQSKLSTTRRHAISDITTISGVLTTNCFKALLTHWIICQNNFWSASSAVLILIDSSKVELERTDWPLVILNDCTFSSLDWNLSAEYKFSLSLLSLFFKKEVLNLLGSGVSLINNSLGTWPSSITVRFFRLLLNYWSQMIY